MRRKARVYFWTLSSGSSSKKNLKWLFFFLFFAYEIILRTNGELLFSTAGNWISKNLDTWYLNKEGANKHIRSWSTPLNPDTDCYQRNASWKNNRCVNAFPSLRSSYEHRAQMKKLISSARSSPRLKDEIKNDIFGATINLFWEWNRGKKTETPRVLFTLQTIFAYGLDFYHSQLEKFIRRGDRLNYQQKQSWHVYGSKLKYCPCSVTSLNFVVLLPAERVKGQYVFTSDKKWT